jgi:hypothetical protein
MRVHSNIAPLSLPQQIWLESTWSEAFTKKLNFGLTNQVSFFPPVYPLSVRGVALWTNEVHNHFDVPIQYEFQCAPLTFLLTSLWAARAD